MDAGPQSARQATPSLAMVLLLGSMMAFAALSIDLYLPGLPAIGAELGASSAATARTVSIFFAGLALGQLVYGPLSDRLGRRPPLLFGVALYTVASLACALAASIEQLTLARLAQALGACAAVVMSRAIVGDLYVREQAARIFSLLILVMGAAPILAPLAGSAILAVASWRWMFAVLAAFGALVGTAILLRLRESRSGATAAQAAAETPLGAYVALLRNRRLMGYVLTGGFNSACLFTYIANSPDLLIGGYGLTPLQFSWLFGLNACGLIIGSQVNRWLLQHVQSDTVLAVACPIVALSGSLLLVAALTGVGGLFGVLVPIFVILATFGFTGANVSAGALACDPLRGGSVSALLGSSGFGFGAAASALATLFHDGTALPIAVVMAAAGLGSVLSFFMAAKPR